MTARVVVPLCLATSRRIVARPNMHPDEAVLDACDILIRHGDWIDVERGTALAAAIRRERPHDAGASKLDDFVAELEADFIRLSGRIAACLWVAAAAILMAIAILSFDQRGASAAPARLSPDPAQQGEPA